MTRALFLLSLFLSFPLSADSRLFLGLAYQSSTHPGGTLPFEASVINDGPDPARNVTLTIPIPPETTVDSISMLTSGWECGERGNAVVCTTPLFAVSSPQAITVVFRAPTRSTGGSHLLRVKLTADDATPRETIAQAVIQRTLVVTSSADSGAGSLRQAIVDANTQCRDRDVPCHVAFDLPKPATIEPLTPLPAITGCTVIFDAQRDVELSGARVSRGNGFEIDSACGGARLTGFTINRFPENGVFVRTGNVGISNAQIGTDLTGELARPNGMRGVVIADPQGSVSIDGSTISGNRLSGIFSVASLRVLVAARIGVSRSGAPLPNGASGIFVARGILSVPSGTIAHHPQFGIAVLPGVFTTIHAGVSIHSNHEAAIDYNLDRRSANDTPGIPNAPQLTEAFFDAATNTTIVRGVHRGGPFASHRVLVYANRIDAELESFAGFTHVVRGATFEVRLTGDQRGHIITAVSQSTDFLDLPDWTTSEVSEGIPVR